MPRFRSLLSAGALLALVLTSAAYPPIPPPKKSPALALPVGKWRVEFDNGVVQTCEVTKDGAAYTKEPLRASAGKATVSPKGFVLIVSNDDRTERWSADGKRIRVEHWCPSSAYPNGKAVRGVARRVP